MSWHCLRFVALIAFICPAAIAQDSSATKPQGLAKREAWASSRIKGSPDPAPPYRVEPAFPALKFEQPLDLSAAPGTERLFF